MGQVTFTTVFSGGAGDLDVSPLSTGEIITFNENDEGPKTRTLAAGGQTIGVSGNAPNGPGGNIALTIDGDVAGAPVVSSFPSGPIPAQNIVIFVTA